MAKNVHTKAGVISDTALVALGWVVFFLANLLPAGLQLFTVSLRAVARVLP